MTQYNIQYDSTTGIDTKVSSSVGTRNFGVSTTILGGTNEKMLIYCSASQIPSGAVCNSACLILYQAGTGAANAFTLTAYAIKSGNSGWIEGTKNNATAGAGEPCWNAKEADGSGGVTTAWAGTAGLSTGNTDFVASPLGTVSGNRSDANGTPYQIDLTSGSIQNWFGSDASNYGILITTSTGNGAIAASDHATSGYHPQFVVDYTVSGSSGSSLITGTVILSGDLSTLHLAHLLINQFSQLVGTGYLLLPDAHTIKFSNVEMLGTGNLLPNGLLKIINNINLSGIGDLQQNGILLINSSVEFTGLAALICSGFVVSGSVPIVYGDAVLSGNGDLVSTAIRIAFGNMQMDGNGILSVQSLVKILANAILNGQGNIEANANLIISAIIALAGAGGIEPIGRIPSAMLPTPFDRTILVQSDNRIFIILTDGRIFSILLDDRNNNVNADSRIYKIQ